MSEWWTYRPSSFLLFSERTYYRLFELYNAALWPLPLLTVLLGAGLLILLGRSGERARRIACALLALAWLWVAWGFHLQRYATVNWAATGFAAAFAVQALLLLGIGVPAPTAPAPRGRRRQLGLGLLALAVFVHPLLAPLAGRPWAQAEVVGLAPDPTALATLGVLLLLPAGAARPRRPGAAAAPAPAWRLGLLWPIPLLWCGLSGLTLWAMASPTAALLPALAVAALLVVVFPGRQRRAAPAA